MKFLLTLFLASLASASFPEMINLVFPDTLVPKVEAFGDNLSSELLKVYDFNYTWVTPIDELGDIGVELVADYDLSFGY